MNTLRPDVNLGASWSNQTGWAYIELVNPADTPLDIVFTTSHLRCDALKAYSLEGDQLRKIGEVARNLPLSYRPFNTFEFALPIRVLPQDTLGFLLCSTRYSGFNVISPILFGKAHFPNFLIKKRLIISFRLSVLLVIILLISGMGILFKQPPLLFLSIYLVSILLLLTANAYFFDLFPYFSTGVVMGSHSVLVFSILISNIFVYFFEYGHFRPYMTYPHRFLALATIIILLNLVTMGIMLMPLTPLINQLFTYGFVVLTLVNMIIFLGYALHAYLRYHVLYLFVLFSALFIPSVIGTLLDSRFVFSIGILESIFTLFVICYLVFRHFQEALISKWDSDNRLSYQRVIMEEIRQEELEKVGRHLHDQIGNLLATAVGYLDSNKVDKSKIRALITEAIQELRFTSHNLVSTKKKQPIMERIVQLVSRYNDYSKITYLLDDYSASALNTLSEQRQENIYLMVLEILSNVERHSEGKQANIQIVREIDTMFISIEDDGVGMPDTQKRDGIGLVNLARRAELNQFKLTMNSSQTGTTVIIEIAL